MYAYPTRITRFLALPIALALALPLASCSTVDTRGVARTEPWRQRTEQACLARGERESPFIRARSALGGPSACGAARPFEMSAAGNGRIGMRPAALLRCPMIEPVDVWLADDVSALARRHLGTDVVEIAVAASYSCRPRNGIAGAKLSEHGLANALDVSAFRLANGRIVTVRHGWNGAPDEQAFLRAVHRAACTHFTTVLGPEADRFHRDHFHVDLASHGRDGKYRVCR